MTYTRYADDLTFSGDDPRVVGRVLRSARTILQAEGFVEHPSKTHVMRQTARQEVTGLVVNGARPSVPRAYLRELRAVLHNCAAHGLASQNREGHPDFAACLRGRVAFVTSVRPDLADVAPRRPSYGPGPRPPETDRRRRRGNAQGECYRRGDVRSRAVGLVARGALGRGRLPARRVALSL
jgi:hypothetical protein